MTIQINPILVPFKSDFDIFIYRLPRIVNYWAQLKKIKRNIFCLSVQTSLCFNKMILLKLVSIWTSHSICMSANGSSKDFLVDFNGFSFYHSRHRLSRLFKWETWKAELSIWTNSTFIFSEEAERAQWYPHQQHNQNKDTQITLKNGAKYFSWIYQIFLVHSKLLQYCFSFFATSVGKI